MVLEHVHIFLRCARVLMGIVVVCVARCKGCKETVLVFACLAAVCEGFEGNERMLSLCAKGFDEFAFLLQCARGSKKMLIYHGYAQGF